jgi:hypothetical protein
MSQEVRDITTWLAFNRICAEADKPAAAFYRRHAHPGIRRTRFAAARFFSAGLCTKIVEKRRIDLVSL